MNRPAFSIIIPTYQRRDLVCQTVRSLAQLKYSGAVEIVVVADGCTDGTAAAVREIECPFPVQVIEQPNSGAGAARNRGAGRASGDIFLFFDDDMVAAADMLEQHACSYCAGADAVVGDFTEPGVQDGVLSSLRACRRVAGRGDSLCAFDVFGGQISMKRGVFEELGGFDESFTGNGDYGDSDIGRRLLERFEVHHNPKALSDHRGLLGPRAHLRRARTCAKATLRFAAKYPELRHELVDWTGADRIGLALRLISRIPLLPDLASEFVAFIAEIGALTPLRSTRAFRYLRNAPFTVAYWSTLERLGGLGNSGSRTK